ncbi:glycosyltransferase family 39 protein [Adhaeribacter radiodurans]|uniref:Glycosyltransferase family 39 protein n=1 Tax=Adhaeribacter radiodurans TaxID=2745197 RepID=A0A7L7LBL2_9BACT|nr:glycosyltransferase family 39 protein [Adhaeribacter radiodurans]QMU30220.1 glycosyltransferase family 39 protein [Adhaeribacter radiodurans]
MSSTFKNVADMNASSPLPSPKRMNNQNLIPLSLIMLFALVIRLLTAFFSGGYAFHDEHFDVIEIAQDWVYGLPIWIYDKIPPRHSMFYAGIHSIIFYSCEALGLMSPTGKMTVVRVLHALYSLLVVYYGYKITELLSNQRNARLVGLMLALIWFIPFMSVRNLVEITCIPPYLAAFYLILKPETNNKRVIFGRYFGAGALFALSFVLRYHILLFVVAVGLVLLYQKQWIKVIYLGLGFNLIAFFIQGTIDITFYKFPFHSVVTYFLYNSDKAHSHSPIYHYVFTILLFLVPPLSIYMLLGYARTAKIAPSLFVAGILFLVVHTAVPNKQAQFILPLIPLIVILGVVGWQSFVQQSKFWQTRRKLLAASWTFFWIINITAAVVLAFTYPNKSRITPLVYLSQKENLHGVLLEFGNQSFKVPPLFYLGHMAAEAEDYISDKKNMWRRYKAKKPLPKDFVMVYSLNDEKPLEKVKAEVDPNYEPNYVVVVGQDELAKRLKRLGRLYSNLKLDQTIAPSLYDQVLHRLNPRVYKDEHVYIYQIL